MFSIIWPSLIIYALRRHIPHEKHKLNNEVGGFIYAVLGVAYAVILAFVVLVDYENYNKAEDIVFSEANAINNFCRDASMLDEPFKGEVLREAIIYAKLVVQDEWKIMNSGRYKEAGNGEAYTALRRLKTLVFNYSHKTEREKEFYTLLVGDFRKMRELRADRLMMSTSTLPGILYFVILVGYVLTVSYTFFFSSLSVKAQITMTSMLSMVLALVIFLIIEMDLPYSGSTAVSPESIEFVIESVTADEFEQGI